ncbi:hypothetical protein IGB42_00858 [Andreprevotia sp. IGB-42]|nr:hypothetical protein IGB42_00858 [Andreprevotia sp. IGB-42]
MGPYRALRAGQRGSIKAVLTLAAGKDGEMWLGCNPQLDRAILSKLDAAVRQLQKRGAVERISAAYR